MKTLPTIGIRVEGTRTAYCLKLNDVVILADRWYESSMDTAIVNHWVFPGLNNVEINLHVPWDDSDRHDRKFKAEILSISKGSEPVIIGELNWAWTESGELPFNSKIEFQLPDDLPSWTWKNAEQIEWNPEIQSQIVQKIEQVHLALSSRDLPELENLLQVKALDMGRAYGIPDMERLAEQNDFFEGLFQNPDFAMQPLDIEKTFFEIEGNGRLVKVMNAKGKPLLITEETPNAGTFGLPIYLALIQGAWQVMR